jgi:hypothetical protein
MASDSWFDQASNGAAVDVHGICGDTAAWKALLDVVEAGALVSLSTTRDGGALGVTVTIDGRWKREYFRDGAEMLTWLDGASDAARSARGSDRPSDDQGSRSRRRSTR